MEINFKKFFLLIITSSLLFSCSQKNNSNDFVLSTLKRSKNIKSSEQEKKSLIKSIDKEVFKNLEPLKNKEAILAKSKYGKKDPFSEKENEINILTSDFELTGFLKTENKSFVFVSYLGKEGTITQDSIGGINTNLLPNGAKVSNIDPINMKLTINFENKNLEFELLNLDVR